MERYRASTDPRLTRTPCSRYGPTNRPKPRNVQLDVALLEVKDQKRDECNLSAIYREIARLRYQSRNEKQGCAVIMNYFSRAMYLAMLRYK